MGNKILELLQSFHRLAWVKFNSEHQRVRLSDVSNLWGRLNNDQRLAVQNRFLRLPEHLRRLAARCEKEKGELLNIIKEKKERLMCPVCYDLPSGEIFSCSNQHVICSVCLPRLVGNICPTCREALGTRPRRHAYAEDGVRELNRLLETTNRVTG